MPFKTRLAQAIQDENSKALQRQVLHIVGPGTLVLLYILSVGSLTVRVVRPPEIFGGGTFDIIAYGILGALISLAISKRYIVDKWLDAWLLIAEVRRNNVAKIEAVMERLETEALEKAGAGKALEPQPDPWMRALAPAMQASEGVPNQVQ